MKFLFESMESAAEYAGSYLMEFGDMESEEDAAIVEGKLLTVFGTPTEVSDNYENSFNYYIRATAEDGRVVMLNIYNQGVIHIGASEEDDLTVQAANALIEYVNAAEVTDYQKTVYYADFCIEINITVKNGKFSSSVLPISEEKMGELFKKWY